MLKNGQWAPLGPNGAIQDLSKKGLPQLFFPNVFMMSRGPDTLVRNGIVIKYFTVNEKMNWPKIWIYFGFSNFLLLGLAP